MSNSITFNDIALSDYGLELLNYPEGFGQSADGVQLIDKSYASDSIRPTRRIELAVGITGADLADLRSNLDNIKKYLNQREDCKLEIDNITDRYWMARFVSIDGGRDNPTIWKGTIAFDLFDPDAYDNTETSSDTNIDDDPHSADETVGGTGQTFPIYTLTCDDTLTDTTVIITNANTGEAISWTGDLVATNILEIDTQTYIVKLNGTEDMATVSGRFPRLLPGLNLISVAGFSGTFNVKYRKRYI